jgi:hypothetical protein
MEKVEVTRQELYNLVWSNHYQHWLKNIIFQIMV